MSRNLPIPGARDVRATLDSTDGGGADTGAVVVACPPHPQFGGTRRDSRLRAVSDALTERSVDCLRFDYGPFDGGNGEQTDLANAVAWARTEYETVGVFGYSFGATVALLATARMVDPDRLSVLAPGAELDVAFDPGDVIAGIDCPLQVVYGENDTTVEWKSFVEQARNVGHLVASLPADHLFVGQQQQVGELVGAFFEGFEQP
jgi:alpha/beta superfamily hydrolase